MLLEYRGLLCGQIEGGLGEIYDIVFGIGFVVFIESIQRIIECVCLLWYYYICHAVGIDVGCARIDLLHQRGWIDVYDHISNTVTTCNTSKIVVSECYVQG